MKKWFYFLVVILVVYGLSRVGKTKKSPSSPFLTRLNQTISIIVWVLLFVYAISFFYWLFTEIF